MVPDKTLRHEVLEELEFEPSVNAAHIGVAAKDGVITLTGHVGGFEQKLAARRVRGVKAVAADRCEAVVRLAAQLFPPLRRRSRPASPSARRPGPARGQAPRATAFRSRIGRESTSWTSISVVSTPIATTRASSRTMACGPVAGSCFNRF